MADERRTDVSVIVPAYNVAAVIRRALVSVATQTVRPGEVVVVDDGSTDGSAEAAEACAPDMRDVALKVIRQDNAGAGAARNRAIKESSGAILAFLDADDEWLPEHLERSLEHMAEEDYALVAHNGWIVDEAGNSEVNDCAKRFREGPDPYDTLYRKGYIDTCTVVARRDVIEAAGGFDETLPNAQDFDLWLAALAPAGTRFSVFEDALSRYYLMPGSIMSFSERRLRCTLKIAVRYAPVLKTRGGGWLKSLWWRVAAIHKEALDAYRVKGEWGKAGAVVLRLPVSLLSSTARTAGFPGRFRGRPSARP